MTLLMLGSAALACGGFFCDGATTTTTTTTQTFVGEAPVAQKSERILFEVDEEAGTTTAYVEVSYIRDIDVPFSWVIPLPDVIDAGTITTASSDLLNALEEATAPRFRFEWPEVTYNYNSYGGYYSYDDGGGGCGGLGCGGDSAKSDVDSATGGFPSSTTGTEEVAVAVVDTAVVGPFAIEVITATDTQALVDWLTNNGYDMPDAAFGPLGHYVGAGGSFMGVRLAPDVPEGPIDTLVFTCPSTVPIIPIILTQIAACPDLPIVTYIVADGPWRPANWAEIPSPAPDVLPSVDGVDYVDRLNLAVDEFGGQAFVREFAGPTALLDLEAEFQTQIEAAGPYITRLRGAVSPEEMTLDPWFELDPGAPDVGRDTVIQLDAPPESYRRARSGGAPGGAWLLLPLLGGLVRRRGR